MESPRQPILTEKRKFLHSLVFPTAFVLLLWIIKLVEHESGWDLFWLGVYPRAIKGISGIFTAPLIHADFIHLFDNSVSLYILSVALFFFYRPIPYRIFFLVYVISGICVWFGGREAYHVGASGLVYGLAAFLFFSGVFRRDIRLSALALIVVFMYGSMIWGIFPLNAGISWESHLWGAISGVILSFVYRHYGPQRIQFEWENEPEQDDEEFFTDSPEEGSDDKDRILP